MSSNDDTVYLVYRDLEPDDNRTNFVGEVFPAPWRAQDAWRTQQAAGVSARVIRVSIGEDGEPVAEWMTWPDSGIYRVHWKSGGVSTAAIGVTADGGRWLAPINWNYPVREFTAWSSIERLEQITIPS